MNLPILQKISAQILTKEIAHKESQVIKILKEIKRLKDRVSMSLQLVSYTPYH